MQGPFGSRQGTPLYLLAWLTFGAALAWLLAATTGAAPGTASLFVLPLTLVYGVAAGFSSYYLCRAHPLGGANPWRILAVFAIGAVCMAWLWTLAAEAWNGLLAGAIGWSRSLAATVFGLGLILYLLCAVANYLAIAFQRARELETRELQAQLAARDSQLRMLRSQVDPHFLFNSLNSISALTSIDPGAAREMTLQLAEFFRRTLGLDAQRRIALSAELDLLGHYMAIERVRFGDRLAWRYEAGDDALACLLPPLLLQPLVENAIKHGIARRLEGGELRLFAARAGSLLRIRLENDDGDDVRKQPGSGMGLANVRERLAAAYAHESAVHVSREDGTFRVELVLPAQTEEIGACA
jgi:hypothetical protein